MIANIKNLITIAVSIGEHKSINCEYLQIAIGKILLAYIAIGKNLIAYGEKRSIEQLLKKIYGEIL